jgi:hypothetical protein
LKTSNIDPVTSHLRKSSSHPNPSLLQKKDTDMETGGKRLSNLGYGLAGEKDEALKNS